MQLAQVARQALQHLLRAGGAQVLCRQREVGAKLACQQLATVAGVQAPAATGVEQVVGTRHAQQEVPGKTHALQRYAQTPGQLEGEDGQGQRLASAALQHLVQHGGMWPQRQVFVLHKPQCIQLAQQRLCQFTQR